MSVANVTTMGLTVPNRLAKKNDSKLELEKLITGDKLVYYTNTKKYCVKCRRGFNKKKGRVRVDSSVYIMDNVYYYKCAKCFSKKV